MLRLYGDPFSGNCYKARLVMAQLQVAHQWVPVDVLKKESRTPDFLAKNPAGQIPLLELEPGVYLPESNAILHYLAHGSALLPSRTSLCMRTRMLHTKAASTCWPILMFEHGWPGFKPSRAMSR